MNSDPRRDPQAHRDEGGCRLCRQASQILAAVALASGTILVLGILLEEATGAGYYAAVLGLIGPTVLAMRVTSWHQCWLDFRHGEGQSTESSAFIPPSSGDQR